MSDLSENVLMAVTDDWQSTREIVDQVPKERGVLPASFGNHVRHHLRKWERYGKIERRWNEEDGRGYEWRRVQ